MILYCLHKATWLSIWTSAEWKVIMLNDWKQTHSSDLLNILINRSLHSLNYFEEVLSFHWEGFSERVHCNWDKVDCILLITAAPWWYTLY